MKAEQKREELQIIGDTLKNRGSADFEADQGSYSIDIIQGDKKRFLLQGVKADGSKVFEEVNTWTELKQKIARLGKQEIIAM